jgi:hypothetical protein
MENPEKNSGLLRSGKVCGALQSTSHYKLNSRCHRLLISNSFADEEENIIILILLTTNFR